MVENQPDLRRFEEGAIQVPTPSPLKLEQALDLGNLLEFLRLAATRGESYPVGTGDDGGILDSLGRVENTLKSSDLDTNITDEIIEFRREVDEKYSSEDYLNQPDLDYLKQKSVAWHHVLRDVLSREQRIPAENTGLLDVDRLIESPEELFSRPVWNWLDERPQSDLKEACKTIVVGCSTASVMLSLRAVEHTLRVWSGKETEEIDAPWGQALDQLMEEYAEEGKQNDTVATQLSDLPPVLSNLYYLKEKRNEVSHPDKSPGAQEARQTLMIAAGTITDIYNEAFEDKIDELRYMDQISVGGQNVQLDFDGGNVEDLFMRVIRDLDDGQGAPRSDVYEFGLETGFDEVEIEEIIREILMGGRAYEPASGRLKAI